MLSGSDIPVSLSTGDMEYKIGPTGVQFKRHCHHIINICIIQVARNQLKYNMLPFVMYTFHICVCRLIAIEIHVDSYSVRFLQTYTVSTVLQVGSIFSQHKKGKRQDRL